MSSFKANVYLERDQFAQAIGTREIGDSRFTIKTNRHEVKVSWQVTGIRHAHPDVRPGCAPPSQRRLALKPAGALLNSIRI
jgi:hypothetical protein